MAAYNCSFDNLLVVDFATTLQRDTYDYAPEIIQFSVTVLDIKNKRIREDVSFNEYCRPAIEPKLTEICIATTGVQQENVDSAQSFEDVYNNFALWLHEHSFDKTKFVVVCHTPITLWKDAQYQFILMNQPLPGIFRQWIDVTTHFLKVTRTQLDSQEILQNNLPRLSEYYGIPLQGEIFDSRNNSINMARIVQKMLEMGQRVDVTGQLTCFDNFRRAPLIWDKTIAWQNDRILFHEMQKRILPLFFKQFRFPYRMELFGKCLDCHYEPDECTGLLHKQYPTQLFNDFLTTGRPVSTFAQYLNLE